MFHSVSLPVSCQPVSLFVSSPVSCSLNTERTSSALGKDAHYLNLYCFNMFPPLNNLLFVVFLSCIWQVYGSVWISFISMKNKIKIKIKIKKFFGFCLTKNNFQFIGNIESANSIRQNWDLWVWVHEQIQSEIMSHTSLASNAACQRSVFHDMRN